MLGRLSRKDNDLKRDASNFFKAVFGILVVVTTKIWLIT